VRSTTSDNILIQLVAVPIANRKPARVRRAQVDNRSNERSLLRVTLCRSDRSQSGPRVPSMSSWRPDHPVQNRRSPVLFWPRCDAGILSLLGFVSGALIDVGPTMGSEWTGSRQASECFGDQEGTNETQRGGCCDPRNALRREEQAILASRIRNGGTKSLMPFRSSGPRAPCGRRSLQARRAVRRAPSDDSWRSKD